MKQDSWKADDQKGMEAKAYGTSTLVHVAHVASEL